VIAVPYELSFLLRRTIRALFSISLKKRGQSADFFPIWSTFAATDKLVIHSAQQQDEKPESTFSLKYAAVNAGIVERKIDVLVTQRYGPRWPRALLMISYCHI
jgi:hypothetical protein